MIGRLIDEVDYVADFVVGLRFQQFGIRTVSQLIGKLPHQICKRNAEFLRLLVLIRRRAGPAGELNLLVAHLSAWNIERQLALRVPDIDLKSECIEARSVVEHPLQRSI